MAAVQARPVLPIPAWEQHEETTRMDPLKFRALHRKLYATKQRIETTRSSYEEISRSTRNRTEREEKELRARVESMRRSRLRNKEDSVTDVKKENIRLVERLCSVMQDSEARQKQIMFPHPPDHEPPSRGTLNTGFRRKVAKQIYQENVALLERLMKAGPSVATRSQLVSRYQVHTDLVARRTRIRRKDVNLMAAPPAQRTEPRRLRPIPPWKQGRLSPLEAKTADTVKDDPHAKTLRPSTDTGKAHAAVKVWGGSTASSTLKEERRLPSKTKVQNNAELQGEDIPPFVANDGTVLEDLAPAPENNQNASTPISHGLETGMETPGHVPPALEHPGVSELPTDQPTTLDAHSTATVTEQITPHEQSNTLDKTQTVEREPVPLQPLSSNEIHSQAQTEITLPAESRNIHATVHGAVEAPEEVAKEGLQDDELKPDEYAHMQGNQQDDHFKAAEHHHMHGKCQDEDFEPDEHTHVQGNKPDNELKPDEHPHMHGKHQDEEFEPEERAHVQGNQQDDEFEPDEHTHTHGKQQGEDCEPDEHAHVQENHPDNELKSDEHPHMHGNHQDEEFEPEEHVHVQGNQQDDEFEPDEHLHIHGKQQGEEYEPDEHAHMKRSQQDDEFEPDEHAHVGPGGQSPVLGPTLDAELHKHQSSQEKLAPGSPPVDAEHLDKLQNPGGQPTTAGPAGDTAHDNDCQSPEEQTAAVSAKEPRAGEHVLAEAPQASTKEMGSSDTAGQQAPDATEEPAKLAEREHAQPSPAESVVDSFQSKPLLPPCDLNLEIEGMLPSPAIDTPPGNNPKDPPVDKVCADDEQDATYSWSSDEKDAEQQPGTQAHMNSTAVNDESEQFEHDHRSQVQEESSNHGAVGLKGKETQQQPASDARVVFTIIEEESSNHGAVGLKGNETQQQPASDARVETSREKSGYTSFGDLEPAEGTYHQDQFEQDDTNAGMHAVEATNGFEEDGYKEFEEDKQDDNDEEHMEEKPENQLHQQRQQQQRQQQQQQLEDGEEEEEEEEEDDKDEYEEEDNEEYEEDEDEGDEDDDESEDEKDEKEEPRQEPQHAHELHPHKHIQEQTSTPMQKEREHEPEGKINKASEDDHKDQGEHKEADEEAENQYESEEDRASDEDDYEDDIEHEDEESEQREESKREGELRNTTGADADFHTEGDLDDNADSNGSDPEFDDEEEQGGLQAQLPKGEKEDEEGSYSEFDEHAEDMDGANSQKSSSSRVKVVKRSMDKTLSKSSDGQEFSDNEDDFEDESSNEQVDSDFEDDSHVK